METRSAVQGDSPTIDAVIIGISARLVRIEEDSHLGTMFVCSAKWGSRIGLNIPGRGIDL